MTIKKTEAEIKHEIPPFGKPLLGDGVVVSWWSGGITSAVACRLALEKYENVKLVYIETGSHHEDTLRFKKDCEKWYGCEIETIQNKKYDNVIDVVLSTKYVNGAGGARCTKELKKEVRFKYEKTIKIAHQVWGYEFEPKEINRAIRTQEQYPDTNPLFPLIENKLTKKECAGIVLGAGIKIPKMYKLGYNNNNCIGCVKGGAGYWNKIRVDFPEIFEEMAKAEREVGASCLKKQIGIDENEEAIYEKIYLDTLNPKAGRKTDLVLPECGLFCQVEFAHIMSDKVEKIINGEMSIYGVANTVA
jgi:hypothetical protein